MYFLLFTMSTAFPFWYKRVGRQPGECRGTKDAAVRHFTTQTVNSVPAHTLRRASKVVLPCLPPPGASQAVPGSVGAAQGCRQQSQPPSLAALLVFSSKFCKSGAYQSHWKTALCAWAPFRPHILNNCKWGWVGATTAPSLIKPEFSTHSIDLF